MADIVAWAADHVGVVNTILLALLVFAMRTGLSVNIGKNGKKRNGNTGGNSGRAMRDLADDVSRRAMLTVLESIDSGIGQVRSAQNDTSTELQGIKQAVDSISTVCPNADRLRKLDSESKRSGR